MKRGIAYLIDSAPSSLTCTVLHLRFYMAENVHTARQTFKLRLEESCIKVVNKTTGKCYC